ncbi:hypothetical protein A2765_00760 [Candidatus Kaiserbacteria bacterium RIFCSPHIGHO2_01_FULL_56_24]|uniref:Uncharacterized protein n=1 Tax=Candidatus Kaiserbacteria bacterium RIFCSPHIGHO2_01_FULL_56_24 TaxID=1798487 RepID=A0A1F6DF08_9BACT|nr:MAG: hypothetical protein A2765_00760 [Candidatus Kaiserbacteria bacterium RIFCSPHIGHO2_01_FULL_56_24]
MQFSPTVLGVDCVEAVVQLPASGIMLTFRCAAKSPPVPLYLQEVERMQPNCSLHEPIVVSAGMLQTALRVAADAIAKHRVEYAARQRRWFNPSQLSLSLSFH